MTTSAPRSRTHSTLLVPVVAATVAPRYLGQLDGVRADAAGAGLDEDLLAGLQVRSLDERLPCGQGDEGHRGRLGHGEARRLDREIVLVHGDALGEGPDAAVARPRVDLVAHAEAHHGGADAGDDAGEVVPEYERRLVREEQLELPVAALRR